jgi:hypothetical protein
MLFATQFITIDDRLRQTLVSLEEGLSVRFDSQMVEKIFIDAEVDQVSEKHYLLLDGKKLRVVGYVEDYESGTLSLRIEVGFFGRSKVKNLLAALFPV